MKSQARLTSALFAIFVVSSAFAQTTETMVTSIEGVVLLRNGKTLQGNITRTGDNYLLSRGVASQIQLPAASVECVCQDMESLYQYKTSAVADGDRASHLDLARWCLQHDLTARAADQMLMVFALDPASAGLDVVERQLLASVQSPEEISQPVSKVPAAPTLQDVEKTIDALPAGALQQFATTVQPLLMNRCATNGCHGHAGQSEFRLLRPNTRQSLSRRMTQRNLISTLGFVDRNQPRQSQLIAMLQTPHGGREAVFSAAETAQTQLFIKWVAGLSSQPVADLPATVAKPPTFLLQTRPEALAELVKAFATEDPQPIEALPAVDVPDESNEAYQPRDAFDPEIFNRRVHRPANSSR